MIRYFAYGSNLSKAAMRLRAPAARPLIAATLADHALTFESNEPFGSTAAFFANVRPHTARTVAGALYELDETALTALDAYEDVGRGVYERARVVVLTAAGARVSAVAYRMPATGRPPSLGLPSPAQLEAIRAGYADWGLDLRALESAIRRIPSMRS